MKMPAYTLNPKPYTLNPKPETYTLNPASSTSGYYRGLNNYYDLPCFGGSLSELWYNIPQNPILIVGPDSTLWQHRLCEGSELCGFSIRGPG